MSELDDKMLAVGALTKVATPFVQLMDVDEHSALPNQAKHDWVYSILLMLVPLLKGSVKEVRGVPDEVLADAADQAITEAVSLIREGAAAIAS